MFDKFCLIKAVFVIMFYLFILKLVGLEEVWKHNFLFPKESSVQQTQIPLCMARARNIKDVKNIVMALLPQQFKA